MASLSPGTIGNYFNPRTREGCDPSVSTVIGTSARISIHAPVKGATRCRGATWSAHYNFNPRTREGCDVWQELADMEFGKISIHAPVKGATAYMTQLYMDTY